MKKYLLCLALALTPVCALHVGGCQSGALAPSGAYAGNKNLYITDASIDSAYKILDVFLSFELANRATVSQDVRDFANKIRREAPAWNKSLFALRDVYALSPTAENKSALDRTLKLVREALTQATIYLSP